MAKGKRKFRGQTSGPKKKRRKISLEKISKMSKERIEREKRRFAARQEDKISYKPAAVSNNEVLSSSDEEVEEQKTSVYQELLSSLGAKKSGYDISDEDADDLEEEEDELEDDEIEELDGDDDDDDGDEDAKIDQDLYEGEDDEDNIPGDGDEVEAADEENEEGDEEEDDEEEQKEEDEEDEEGEGEEEEEEEADSSDKSDSSSDDEDDTSDAKEKHTHQMQDPFYRRVNHEMSDGDVQFLSKGKPVNKFEVKWPCLGKCQCSAFDDTTSKADMKVSQHTDFKSLHIPKRVSSAWKEANASYLDGDSNKILSPLQQELFSVMNSYQDLVYPERTHENAEEVRLAYCLHVLSHIIKSRNLVQKHNSLLTADPDLDTETMRDQGLTRPRVLILVPFRNAALKIVKVLAQILVPEKQQMSHKKRFFDEYGAEKDSSKLIRPEDWEETFEGNIDDHFRLGVSITRKSFRLYSTFYNSDIIISSPLGLRTVIGTKEEDHHEYDFLSSIELLVMDQTDVFLMQNWEHVMHIMDHLHLQPKDSHDVDFSRVRMWALNKWNKFYRQTLIFSGVTTPEVNALVSKQCANFAGRVTVCNTPALGSIGQVAIQLPQVFNRIECDSFASSHDKRFNFFISKILPQYRDSLMAGTVIFIPSYFDFVRVRNYFRKQEISFAQICEYTSQSNISRARLYMMKGMRNILLLTERFHFFRRYKIRGLRHIVFYQLPTYPHFYSELSNMLEASTPEGATQDNTCSVLYTKYDVQRLGSVVGLQRSTHMLYAEKDVHMFVSGDG